MRIPIAGGRRDAAERSCGHRGTVVFSTSGGPREQRLGLAEKMPEVSPATRIARQGIYDRDGRLVAGGLLFRGHHADHSGLPPTWDAVHDDSLAAIAAEAAADQATSHVIVTTFGDFGVERLGGGKPLFIDVTRSFLAGDYPLPFGPEGVVLEILENVRADQEVLAGVAALRERGFLFALDDYVGEDHRAPLVDLVDVVKVDVLAPGVDTAAVAAAVRARRPDVRLLAERVESAEVLRACHDAGYELFQGFHLAHPDVMESTSISPSQVICMRLLQALGDPASDADDLEEIVAADPGLAGADAAHRQLGGHGQPPGDLLVAPGGGAAGAPAAAVVGAPHAPRRDRRRTPRRPGDRAGAGRGLRGGRRRDRCGHRRRPRRGLHHRPAVRGGAGAAHPRRRGRA